MALNHDDTMVSHLRLTQAETKTWSNTEYRVTLQVAQTTERVSTKQTQKQKSHALYISTQCLCYCRCFIV